MNTLELSSPSLGVIAMFCIAWKPCVTLACCLLLVPCWRVCTFITCSLGVDAFFICVRGIHTFVKISTKNVNSYLLKGGPSLIKE